MVGLLSQRLSGSNLQELVGSWPGPSRLVFWALLPSCLLLEGILQAEIEEIKLGHLLQQRQHLLSVHRPIDGSCWDLGDKGLSSLGELVYLELEVLGRCVPAGWLVDILHPVPSRNRSILWNV